MIRSLTDLTFQLRMGQTGVAGQSWFRDYEEGTVVWLCCYDKWACMYDGKRRKDKYELLSLAEGDTVDVAQGAQV